MGSYSQALRRLSITLKNEPIWQSLIFVQAFSLPFFGLYFVRTHISTVYQYSVGTINSYLEKNSIVSLAIGSESSVTLII